MPLRRLAAFAAAAFATPALLAVPSVQGHRSGCHAKHVCPSDHATYKWKGRYCVKPDSKKRTPAFKKKVRFQGRTYYCK